MPRSNWHAVCVRGQGAKVIRLCCGLRVHACVWGCYVCDPYWTFTQMVVATSDRGCSGWGRDLQRIMANQVVYVVGGLSVWGKL